jgi:hypothetical protein
MLRPDPSVKRHLQQHSLTLQLPLTAALCSLAVGLAIVLLATVSVRHLQSTEQEAMGQALSALLAQQARDALETGDLLSLAATLQQFRENADVARVSVFDVDDRVLAEAGAEAAQALSFRSPVRVGADVAGQAMVTLEDSAARESRQRYLLSLSALAVVLALLVFSLSRFAAQRLAQRLQALSQRLSLEQQETAEDGAELAQLEARIDALPLELLRAHTQTAQREEHYRGTTVLYLQLDSLAGYVSTLNESNLLRYTTRLHRIVYAAAGCYAGTLQVARQFGLVVCFAEEAGRGSAAVRAASCAWLVRSVARELEQGMTLSFSMSMALGHSELGPGSSEDIYPGLYLQAVMDELRETCLAQPDAIVLTHSVADSSELEACARTEAGGSESTRHLLGFAPPHADLVERQRDLLLARLRKRSPRH